MVHNALDSIPCHRCELLHGSRVAWGSDEDNRKTVIAALGASIIKASGHRSESRQFSAICL